MATKRLRGGRWHYTVRRSGLLPRPVYRSFASEDEGDRWAARLEKLLDHGIIPPEVLQPDRPEETLRGLIGAYLDAYKVSPADRALLERMREDLPDRLVSQIDYHWGEGIVATWKTERLAPGTIRHKVGALARCLDWAARRESIHGNPLRLLPKGYSTYQDGRREDVERDRRLEPGEEEAIRRVLAGGYRPDGKQRALELKDREAHVLLFDLALETAMRLSELYTLTPAQVDLERRTIFLDRTKNGDKRQVPLTSVAEAALRIWEPAGDYLLPFYDGDRGRTTSRLSRLWGRVFEHAGCPDLVFHDLRHEATCRFFERTSLDAVAISKITGHRSLTMLRRYASLRGSDLAGMLW